MKCKCGYNPMDRHEINRYICPKCNDTCMENEEGMVLVDYEKAWKDLTKWMESSSGDFNLDSIPFTRKEIQEKMKEIIDEQ